MEFALLLNKNLNHRHPRNVLLKEGIDLSHTAAYPTVGSAHFDLENHGDNKQKRYNGKAHQRQFPIQPEHDEHDAGQGEDVAEDADDARGEKLIEDVHVVGDSSDQTTDWISVKVSHVQSLDVSKDLHAKVVHDLLSHPMHEVGLDEPNDELKEENEQEKQGDGGKASGISGHDVSVNGHQGKIGSHQP